MDFLAQTEAGHLILIVVAFFVALAWIETAEESP